MNTNIINQQQFRQVVNGSQGLTKIEMIERLNVDRDRMNRAQKRGVANCWLFVQEEGRVRRYFTVKYAVDNKIPKIIEVMPKLGNRTVSGCNHSPATMELLAHCRFIDRHWPLIGT